jgi:hypothetical protein
MDEAERHRIFHSVFHAVSTRLEEAVTEFVAIGQQPAAKKNVARFRKQFSSTGRPSLAKLESRWTPRYTGATFQLLADILHELRAAEPVNAFETVCFRVY